MKFYYEFDEQSYYALVTVTVEETDLYTRPYKKAIEIYQSAIKSDKVDDVSDLMPEQVPMEIAFLKYTRSTSNLGLTVRKVHEQFIKTKDAILLLDISLS